MIQIRNVPDRLHRRLKARAALAGMTLSDYLRVELHVAAETEMVTDLDDFMRRRSKIDLVVPDSDIRAADGLRDVARILFGDRADEKLAAYLATPALS